MLDLLLDLSIQPKHTTAYVTSYSGDLWQLLDHFNGDAWTAPHDFVNRNSLRKFLLREKFISEDEFPLSGGTNGCSYWLFFPEVEKHRQKLAEKSKERLFIYSPNDPFGLGEDECGLVTSAFVIGPSEYFSSEYIPVRPEDFTARSVLNVTTLVQFKPGVLNNYGNSIRDGEIHSGHVNVVLADLRAYFYKNITEQPRVNTSFGYGMHTGIQGVDLRRADYDTYRWAQTNVLPALKTILENVAVRDAILLQRELERLPVQSAPSEEGDDLPTRVKRTIAEQQQGLKNDLIEKYYQPAIKSAAEELRDRQLVVDALRVI